MANSSALTSNVETISFPELRGGKEDSQKFCIILLAIEQNDLLPLGQESTFFLIGLLKVL